MEMVPFVARVTVYATISFVIDFDTALWTGMRHISLRQGNGSFTGSGISGDEGEGDIACSRVVTSYNSLRSSLAIGTQ